MIPASYQAVLWRGDPPPDAISRTLVAVHPYEWPQIEPPDVIHLSNPHKQTSFYECESFLPIHNHSGV